MDNQMDSVILEKMCLVLCFAIVVLINRIEMLKYIEMINKNIEMLKKKLNKKMNKKDMVEICSEIDDKMEIMIGTRTTIRSNKLCKECMFMEKHDPDLMSYVYGSQMHFDIHSLKYLPMVKTIDLIELCKYSNVQSIYYYDNDNNEKVVLYEREEYDMDEDQVFVLQRHKKDEDERNYEKEDDEIMKYVKTIRPDVQIIVHS